MKDFIKNQLNASIGGTLGLEAVAFQHNRNLFLALTECFEPLVAKGKKSSVSARDLREAPITQIIKEHTNLTFSLGVWAGQLNACVYPPQFDSSHPFYNGWYNKATEDSTKILAKATAPVRGTIDLQKGWVTGVYADLEMKMMLGTSLFTSGMTAEMIAAITLHEIGHVMSYIEFLGDYGQFNLLLLGLTKAVTEHVPTEKRVEILKLIEKHTETPITNRDEIAKSDDIKDYIQVIVSDRPTGKRSSSGAFYNDIKAWEFASDQFAVRQGAAKALAEGMNYLYQSFGSTSTLTTAGFFGTQVAEIIALIWFGVFSFGIIPLLILLTYNPFASTYDDDCYRIKRMRLSLIEAVKDKDLDLDVRKRYNMEIKAIGDITDTLKDREGLIAKIRLLISPSLRREKREIILQQLTESLGNNDLFLAGSRFKSL